MQGTVGSPNHRFQRPVGFGDEDGMKGSEAHMYLSSITSSCMYQLVSQCRRTCNQIWTVVHMHAGNYESVKSVNCGVELQRKILETCRCFLFSCFISFHFVSLDSLPRVASWWRTTRVTMVPPVPTARLRNSFDFGPPSATPCQISVQACRRGFTTSESSILHVWFARGLVTQYKYSLSVLILRDVLSDH